MKPGDIPAVCRLLRREYAKRYAPVVKLAELRADDPFKVLVTTILSARTKDEMTIQVAERLFSRVKGPGDFRRMSQDDIEKLIFPIGFYRTKARHLKLLPEALDSRFGGRIPQSVEELCELPGVGRKTANLVVVDAFDKYGICVDVHVHRITNRLGLVRTRNPLETEMALRKILPRRYWKRWNSFLVSFGQTVCKPVRPLCGLCPIYRHCARIGVRVSG